MTAGRVWPDLEATALTQRLAPWRHPQVQPDLLLVLAATATAEVEGISAAGASAASRRYTALADAELLLYGPGHRPRWPLPPLPAGVSPALISWVAAQTLGLRPQVAVVGLQQQPPFPHLRLESCDRGPAACLSSGRAMAPDRVNRLWQRGERLGRSLRRPLVLAECVPGGTSTAQAAFTALGLPVADLVSGSALHPPMQLKRRLVEAGLQRAALGPDPSPQAILAAVGDPFQAVATGLLLGAMESGQPVLLAGGSQMLAVLALALRALPRADRAALTTGVILGTTAWLATESLSGRPALRDLLARLERALAVEILALPCGLRFDESRHQALRDYERGYVKEGVGAGALVLLAQLRGCSLERLRRDCEQALDALQRL
jgi:uncharacterized protein (TIGR00303 family)